MPHREDFDQHEIVRQAHQPSEVMTAITWAAARRTKVQAMHVQMPARHVASRFGHTIWFGSVATVAADVHGLTIMIFACAFEAISAAGTSPAVSVGLAAGGAFSRTPRRTLCGRTTPRQHCRSEEDSKIQNFAPRWWGSILHGLHMRLIGQISVSLSYCAESVELVVIDDGWGPATAPKPGQGFGIASDLAEQFHGTLGVGRHNDNTVARIILRTMR